MDALLTGLGDAFASLAYASEASISTSIASKSSSARAAFQWGGTIFDLFLLILNRFGQDSRTQSTLLVLYLFISLPEVLFKILREQFGCWVSFLAIVASMFFPHTVPVPVSRFLLFVIAPNLIAHGLRNSMVGGVFCLVIGISIVMVEIRGNGGFRNCSCNFRCFAYYLCVVHGRVDMVPKSEKEIILMGDHTRTHVRRSGEVEANGEGLQHNGLKSKTGGAVSGTN